MSLTYITVSGNVLFSNNTAVFGTAFIFVRSSIIVVRNTNIIFKNNYYIHKYIVYITIYNIMKL